MKYKRRTMALFLVVAIVPALVVSAVWYASTETLSLNLTISNIVVPSVLLGLIPALILSAIFAELLARPVRRIHAATTALREGNYRYRTQITSTGEFGEIAAGLDEVSEKLERILSESQTETRLIAAERNKLRSILDSMTDGVFALDQDGRIMLFNKAASEITGRPIGSVAGQLAEKVMPFRHNNELVMTRWLARSLGTEQRLGQWQGLELYRADGQKLKVNVQAVRLTNDPNGITALITFHDLTKAQQLEQMEVDFVALAAHELRTPVTEIRGYLDMLVSEPGNVTRAGKDLVERGVVSAGQLTGLINNLLNVARIEHGELSFQPEPVDWDTFLHDMVPNLRQAIGKRQIVIDVPKRLPKVWLDPVGIKEVLTNLIGNAVDHTDQSKGQITIDVKREGEYISTTVTDNGTGIPADAMPHLFTKFFRVEGLHTTSRGTGLGLYISRAIIETHGGHITATSVEGHGSQFTFWLPVHKTTHPDTKTGTKLTGGAHGWIKTHSVR